MSALSYIGLYGSSTDESDPELEKSEPIKLKLEVPDLSCIPGISSSESEAHVDNPSLHGGRVRAFPHVRGNWASFIYLKYPKEDKINNLTGKLLGALNGSKVSLHLCDDFHISLSKTVVLQYHLITTFTQSLQEELGDIECFELDFNSLKVYCNEDKTRTFISMEVDYFTKRQLLKIVKKVDSVLNEFRLPLFYEDPSFHMSILWSAGNKEEELTKFIEELNNIFNKDSGNNIKPVVVSDLNCKIGNKYFHFPLL